MSGHTAPPWIVANMKAGAWIINGGPDAYYPVCSRGSTVEHMEGESYANARLIAAAPETAAELERVQAKLGALCGYPLCDCGPGKVCMVLDAAPPEVCARADLINLNKKYESVRESNAELVEALNIAKRWFDEQYGVISHEAPDEAMDAINDALAKHARAETSDG